MKTTLPLSLALYMAASAVSAQTTDPTKQQLEQRYNALHMAFIRKDAASFAGFYVEGYTSTQPNGAVYKKARVVRDFTAEMNGLVNPRWDTTIKTVSYTKDGVNVLVDGRMSSDLGASNQPLHKMELKAETTDHWIRVDGVWMLKWSKVSSFHVMMDGHPSGGK